MPLLRNVRIIVTGSELGWVEIKNLTKNLKNVEHFTRGDQRNLENLGAPSE
jgi:hypothetical protein